MGSFPLEKRHTPIHCSDMPHRTLPPHEVYRWKDWVKEHMMTVLTDLTVTLAHDGIFQEKENTSLC